MNKQLKKQRKALFFAVVLTATALFLSCTAPAEEPENIITPGTKGETIFVASDLHLYSENLLGPNNERCTKENMSSDGRIQECDYELVSALIDEVNAEKPEYLILTGDLSYNGEKDSHVELTKMLREIKDTKVLVIPGNHDMYSLSSFSALEDTTKRIRSIDMDDFRDIYTDFGYSGAYSYDENSLSYIYELSEDKWALMLDTTLTKYNEEIDLNIVGGTLEEGTMTWLEENLKYANENDISIISFSHHNLLVHNDLYTVTHTIKNYEDLLNLCSQYGVNLNFSGHLHIQSIKDAEIDENTIYDIASGSVLDYGNRYGRLDIYDNCYSYEAKRLDFGDPEYSFRVFCDEFYAKSLKRNQTALGEEKGEEATRLLSEINAYYFDGNYEKIHELINDNKQLIRQIKKNTADYDTSYVKSIMEVENMNQHRLIVER